MAGKTAAQNASWKDDITLWTHSVLTAARHIYKQAGFKHVEYMSVVFKKKVGVPPSEYRDSKGR